MIDATCPRKRRRVLVVDNEPGVRGVIRLVLERAGYSVAEAPDCKLASDMVATRTFDLVIADLMMSETGVSRIVSAIRATNPATPVIALSGGDSRPNPDLLLHLSDIAADAVLPKPFLPTQLVKTVRRLLEDGSTGAEAARRQPKAAKG